MSWVSSLVAAVLSLLKGPLSTIGAYLAGERHGRTKQRAEQSEADIEALRRGADADVKLDDDSLRNSERNRDLS